jgi:group I intron endonuclease
MNSGIYAIRNLINDKRYVGSTINFDKRRKQHLKLLERDKHWNVKLSRSVLKHGLENFTFEILEYLPYNKDIVTAEDEWIEFLDSKKNGYNIADASFGDQLSNHPNREEIIKKISAGLLKTFAEIGAEGRKIKFGRSGEANPMYGKKRPQSVIDAMRAGTKKFMLDHGHGPTTGYKQSAATKQRLSELAKQRIGGKNPFFGKTHSEVSKAKMSLAATGKKCATLRPFFLNGVRYERLIDAQNVTGVKISTLHYRASSNNPKFNSIYFEDSPK